MIRIGVQNTGISGFTQSMLARLNASG